MRNKLNTTPWKNTVVFAAGLVAVLTVLTLSGELAKALGQLFLAAPWAVPYSAMEVIATTVPSTAETTQTLSINRTNPDSRVYYPSGNTKEYTISFRATEGFTIQSYEWAQEKAQRLRDLDIQIVDGGKGISATFSLNAAWKLLSLGGEKGHLKGTLVTHETKNVPKSDRVLGRFPLDGDGKHRLTRGDIADGDSLALRYSAADGIPIEWSANLDEEHVLEPCGVLRCAAVVLGTEDGVAVAHVRTFWRFFKSKTSAGPTIALRRRPRDEYVVWSRFVERFVVDSNVHLG